MDGIEAQKQVVTIATTNCLALLDKALSQRHAHHHPLCRGIGGGRHGAHGLPFLVACLPA